MLIIPPFRERPHLCRIGTHLTIVQSAFDEANPFQSFSLVLNESSTRIIHASFRKNVLRLARYVALTCILLMWGM
jgi:hypothetical protein